MTRPAVSAGSEHVQALVERVRSVRAQTGRRARLAIEGPSGSGKSTLAFAVASALGDAYVLQSDTYHVPLDAAYRLRAGVGVAGAMIDWRRMRREVLHAASADGELHWVWQNLFDDTVTVEHVVPPGHELIVDGTFCCRPELWDCYDVRVLVTCDRATFLERRRARDEDMPAAWRDYVSCIWDIDESGYVEGLDPQAFDVVVSTG